MNEVKDYPPYLDYPKSYTASADEHKHKIKTSFARIVVEGTPEKPYYNIEYFDPTDKEYHIGFGSYYLDNVFNWFAEEFEITESHTDTDTDCISRAALLDRYDAEHVGPPGRARELMVTAPAANVVPAVELEDLRAKYHALVAEKDKNSGDVAETYTTGYRYGHRNGQIELLQQILGIFDGVSEPEETNE